MSFITRLALSRRPVTILIVILLFAAGIYSYNTIQRELFPAIEFPNIIVSAYYGNSDPETIMRDITEPIEDAISGVSGLKEVESTSTESQATVLATFQFGTDMEEAEREIESAVNGVTLPADAFTFVSRIGSDTFPVMQLTVSGDTDIPSLQRLVDDVIEPRIKRVEGVSTIYIQGEVEEQVVVEADTDKLRDLGLSMFHLSEAISGNNSSRPAGSIRTGGTAYPVRTTGEFGSIQDIRDLSIGFERTGDGSPQPGARAITVSEVAQVELTTASTTRIARANGNPSLSLIIMKEPDANTLDVTENVDAALDELRAEAGALPSNVQILELSNDGPYLRETLNNLQREGTLGFLFAVLVVFAFLLNIRPSFLRGIALSLRPSIIIAVSIPLSVLCGVLLLSFTDVTLNFMSLSGLAIAVGRVVDDSIVVLENMYRHVNEGEDRAQAALSATREVSAAILSSTLATVAIFVPLAFIQGIVGEFFSPFAISISLALLASTAVAITVVPVLGAILLRPSDFAHDFTTSEGASERETTLQRIYTPIIVWSLRYKFLTIAVAILVTIGSVVLTIRYVPVVFFSETTPEYVTVDIELPVGASIDRTYQEVLAVERVLEDFAEQGYVKLYNVTLGSAADEFGGSTGSASHIAGIFIRLEEDVPSNIADTLREAMPEPGNDADITVQGISGGPPQDGLEIKIVGSDFNEISDVARRLEERLSNIDGVINLNSTVSAGKDEVVIRVDATKAGEYGLSASSVGSQVNQFIIGNTVSEISVQGETVDVVLRGMRDDVDDIDKLKNLEIAAGAESVKLGMISDIGIEKAPLSITRFDNARSANITGLIVAEDTQAVGRLVQDTIDTLDDVPPGVQIKSGGIFDQINEGFQDVFLSMAIGIALVYLVMVASMGALRTPFIIVLSLPLAVVGGVVALFLTNSPLGISSLMGFLLLMGIVVTNAIVLLTFVEQLRERGYSVYDALVEGGRVRLRPILMTALTTTFALIPLALTPYEGGIIGAQLAVVVIGGLISSTFLTLLVVPSVYWVFNVSIPSAYAYIGNMLRRNPNPNSASAD